MKKFFIKNGEVKLIYEDLERENRLHNWYDDVIKAEQPARPNTADGEQAVLKYDGTDLYYDVVKVEAKS